MTRENVSETWAVAVKIEINKRELISHFPETNLLRRSIFQVNPGHSSWDYNTILIWLDTSEPVLNILQDIAEEMLVKFCATLKVNSERALLHQSTGFVVSVSFLVFVSL